MKTAIFFICLMAMVGCNSASQIVVGTVRQEIPQESVKVYITPPEKYEEVANLSADSMGAFNISNQGRVSQILKKLKISAAKLGANGLILGEKKDGVGFNPNLSQMNAIAIYVEN